MITYNLLINLFLCHIIWKEHYRQWTSLLLSLYVIGIIYNTQELIYYMEMEKNHSLFYAACAGFILLIIGQFASLIIFGLPDHLPIDRTITTFKEKTDYVGGIHPDMMIHFDPYQQEQQQIQQEYQQQQQQEYQQQSYHPYQHQQNENETIEQQRQNRMVDEALNTVYISPYAEFKHPVVCLHDYSAHVEDPNELSFDKGEILYIHDKRGSWWQAKKSDGTVGMIPSNFVTSTSTPGY
ncbi:unnamed protein product [Cunninghamella echinulata]